ncbi:MAG: XTP/dITP diphosphatase [Eubacteriales bacterium]
MRIVIATGNDHKKEEIKEILGNQFEIVTMKEEGIQIEIEENGSSFEENALIKARSLIHYTHDHIIADDSGLEVDYLGGQPGIYSARYAGAGATDNDNNTKLLAELNHVPISLRHAKFVCVIAMIFPDGREHIIKGECKGTIALEYNGSGGFGYDPLFIVDGVDKTFAQLTSQEKNRISHRGEALQQLKELLMNNRSSS